MNLQHSIEEYKSKLSKSEDELISKTKECESLQLSVHNLNESLKSSKDSILNNTKEIEANGETIKGFKSSIYFDLNCSFTSLITFNC